MKSTWLLCFTLSLASAGMVYRDNVLVARLIPETTPAAIKDGITTPASPLKTDEKVNSDFQQIISQLTDKPVMVVKNEKPVTPNLCGGIIHMDLTQDKSATYSSIGYPKPVSTGPYACSWDIKVSKTCPRGILTLDFTEASRLADDKLCARGYVRLAPFLAQNRFCGAVGLLPTLVLDVEEGQNVNLLMKSLGLNDGSPEGIAFTLSGQCLVNSTTNTKIANPEFDAAQFLTVARAIPGVTLHTSDEAGTTTSTAAPTTTTTQPSTTAGTSTTTTTTTTTTPKPESTTLTTSTTPSTTTTTTTEPTTTTITAATTTTTTTSEATTTKKAVVPLFANIFASHENITPPKPIEPSSTLSPLNKNSLQAGLLTQLLNSPSSGTFGVFGEPEGGVPFPPSTASSLLLAPDVDAAVLTNLDFHPSPIHTHGPVAGLLANLLSPAHGDAPSHDNHLTAPFQVVPQAVADNEPAEVPMTIQDLFGNMAKNKTAADDRLVAINTVPVLNSDSVVVNAADSGLSPLLLISDQTTATTTTTTEAPTSAIGISQFLQGIVQGETTTAKPVPKPHIAQTSGGGVTGGFFSSLFGGGGGSSSSSSNDNNNNNNAIQPVMFLVHQQPSESATYATSPPFSLPTTTTTSKPERIRLITYLVRGIRKRFRIG